MCFPAPFATIFFHIYITCICLLLVPKTHFSFEYWIGIDHWENKNSYVSIDDNRFIWIYLNIILELLHIMFALSYLLHKMLMYFPYFSLYMTHCEDTKARTMTGAQHIVVQSHHSPNTWSPFMITSLIQLACIILTCLSFARFFFHVTSVPIQMLPGLLWYLHGIIWLVPVNLFCADKMPKCQQLFISDIIQNNH